MKIDKSALLFFFSLLVIVPVGYSEGAMDNSMIPKYLLWGISLLVVIAFSFKKIEKSDLQLTIPDFALIGYLFFAIPSIFIAINFSEALFETSKMALMLCTYFLAKYFIYKEHDRSVALIPFFAIIATIIVALFSIKEFFEALRLDEPLSASVYLIQGLNGHKNLLSCWLLLLMPLTGLGLIKKGKIPFILLVSTLIFQLVFLLVLQTRAVFFGLFLGGLAFVFIMLIARNKQSKTILLNSFYLGSIALFVFIIVLLFTPIIENALLSFNLGPSSSQERLILWAKTIQLIKGNFLFGVGGGNWKFLFPSLGLTGLYRAELNNVIFLRPHNDFLWMWAEHGFLSFIAYLSFLLVLIHQGLKHISNKINTRSITLMIAALFAYVGMSLFDFPKERAEHQIGFAILAALLSFYAGTESKKYSLKISKSLIIIPTSMFCLFYSYLGYNRLNSESNVRKLIAFKEAGNQSALIEEANKIDAKWMQVDNNAVPIEWYKGNANYNLGNQKAAFKNYLASIEINPYSFNALNNVATCYFLEKNYVEAEKYYLKALSINPRFEESILNISATYVNTQQWDKAKYWIEKVPSKSQRSESLRNLIMGNS